MANDAIFVNPANFDGDSISQAYSSWYFAVCAFMTTAAITFIALAARIERRGRIFHYITAAIVLVAAVAYYSMGSNLGWVAIPTEFRQDRAQARQILYVRYIDWVITTPLLLLDLLLTAGTPTPTILFVILCDELMIVTGLVGALVPSSYKWGYWTFGTAALFYILYHLLFASLKHSARYGKDVKSVFLRCGALTSVLWLLYPVAWALCEGGNVLSTNAEAIFYGILDIFAKIVFGALLIHGHRNIDPARLGIHIKDYNEEDPVAHNRRAKLDDQLHGTRPEHDVAANHPSVHEPNGATKPETTV